MEHPEGKGRENNLLIERSGNGHARAYPSNGTAQNPNETGLFSSRRPAARLSITC